MKRAAFLLAVALAAVPVSAQDTVSTAPCRMDGTDCPGTYAGTPAPTGAAANAVAVFLGSPLRLSYLAAGTPLQVLRVNAGGTALEWAAAGAAGAGGADTQIQYSDAGTLNGHAGFTLQKASGAVGLTAPFTLTPGADIVPLTVRAYSSGTSYIQQNQDSSNNVLSGWTHAGEPFLVAGKGAGKVLTSDANGVGTWGTAAGGITNGAGANVVPKSNGTNLVASTVTDDGTTLTLGNAGVTVTEATGALKASTVTGSNLTSGRVPIVGTSGLITDDSGLTYDAATDTLTTGAIVVGSKTLTGPSAGVLQLGAAAADADGVDQTLQTQGGITGTNRAAGDLTIQTGVGTGTGASSIIFKAPTPQATGTTPQTNATVLTLKDSGTSGTSIPQVLAPAGLSTGIRAGVLLGANQGLAGLASGLSLLVDGSKWHAQFYDGARVAFPAGAAVGWSPSASTTAPDVVSANDLILTRGAAATLQLGADSSATPVAQTLQAQGSRGGTDTDVPGANLTIQSGAGTGNGTSSTLNFYTPAQTTSGTTAQTQTLRMTIGAQNSTILTNWNGVSAETSTLGITTRSWRSAFLNTSIQGSKTKTFTNNTKTGFVTIAVPSSTIATGKIIYEILAKDATNTQAISGTLQFSAAANSSGTVTAATTADAYTPMNPCTSGTLTNATTQTTGANTLTIEFQPNSSLTATTLEIHWRIDSPGTQAITAL